MQRMTKLLHCLKLLANGCSPPSAFPGFFPMGCWMVILESFLVDFTRTISTNSKELCQKKFFQRNDQGHHLMCVCHSPQCTLENMAGMAWLVPLVSSSTVLDWQQDWSDDCIMLLSFVSVHKSYTSIYIFLVWLLVWLGQPCRVVSCRPACLHCRVVSCCSSYSYLLTTYAVLYTRFSSVSNVCVPQPCVPPPLVSVSTLVLTLAGDGDGMW